MENCSERTSLVMEYSSAGHRYAAATARLDENVRTGPPAEHLELSQIAENARLEVETARLAIEAHAKTHGC